MKKLFAFRYVSLHLFATLFCMAMIFSALPYQNETAHSVYVSIAVASGLLFACLWGGGTIVRRCKKNRAVLLAHDCAVYRRTAFLCDARCIFGRQ